MAINRITVRQDMGTSSKALAARLSKLASRQHGCFTAGQAVEVGYADSVHRYHVNTGSWTRVYRGVYRLTVCPATPESRCMAALLWTRGRDGNIQGFLSHETADSLREGQLQDGQTIHIAVFPEFRRSSPIPEGICIHQRKNRNFKTSKFRGLPVEDEPILEVPSSSRRMAFPAGMDLPDYYDWLDYERVRCDRPS